MAVQKIDIKKIIGEEKIRNNAQTKKKSLMGSVMGGAIVNSIGAMTKVPIHLLVGIVLFLVIYGAGSLIWDIISLIKYLINL